MTVLECLRVFGPIAFSGICRRTDLSRDVVAIQLSNHLYGNEAFEAREGWFDCTEEGDRRFKREQAEKRRIKAAQATPHAPSRFAGFWHGRRAI